MTCEPIDIVVIPSISDPRNTLTSIAMFQNAFNIDPPMPIVVVYGTCPDEFDARGEGGRLLPNWEPPWDHALFDEYRKRFSEVAESNRIPVIFFDNRTQHHVWTSLKERAFQKEISLPDGITQDDFINSVNGIFGATYSYGAQRNKAFIAAHTLAARYMFFFDDDTFLAPHVGNMIGRHKELLERQNVYAVTGGYFGQRAFNATIFRRIDEQQEFMGLLGYEIPDDQATQDLWGWRMADGVLGGNFCTKQSVYASICCPSMHRTPTTDDKLIGREIRRVFGKQAHVYKTGWPVVHSHFPHRMNPDQVREYLRSWARTKAFWAIYDKMSAGSYQKQTERAATENGEDEAKTIVNDFGEALLKLAKLEEQVASGELAKAIHGAADAIVENSEMIVDTVSQEIRAFQLLRRCWRSILDAASEIEDLWEKGRNRFEPVPPG